MTSVTAGSLYDASYSSERINCGYCAVRSDRCHVAITNVKTNTAMALAVILESQSAQYPCRIRNACDSSFRAKSADLETRNMEPGRSSHVAAAFLEAEKKSTCVTISLHHTGATSRIWHFYGFRMHL